MQLFFKTLILLFAIPLLSQAQRNYKSGYVVNTKGDTLRGFIDYRGWDLSPHYIRFKTSKDGADQKLTPDDINFFSIDKTTSYRKFTGKISMDNTSEDHMIQFRDTSYKFATVFLKVLQKGKSLALYSYTDAIKTRLYYGEQPEYEPIELVYRLYYDTDAVTYTHGKTVNEDTYMKQLYNLAVKYDAISLMLQKDIENAGYRDYYVNEIVKKINKTAK